MKQVDMYHSNECISDKTCKCFSEPVKKSKYIVWYGRFKHWLKTQFSYFRCKPMFACKDKKRCWEHTWYTF